MINKSQTNIKSTIQPIIRQDGSYAISDNEIITEMKLQYGKKSLEVKNSDPDWYIEIENFVENKIEDTKFNLHRSEIKEDFEN